MKRQYHLFDADGKILGRLSTEAVTVLSGKNKVDYTPHIDAGDFVVIINAKKIVLTGNKENDKIYYRFSGYPGGISKASVKEQREKDASKIIRQAVLGMLPKNKLGKAMLTRLFIFNDDNCSLNIDVKHN